MKIWHQGFVDFGKTPVYRASFERHLAQILPAGVSVTLHGLQPGTFGPGYTPIEALRHPYVAHLLDNQICEAALAAEAAGYDAMAINCFYDPALRAARSLVDIPVVSLFESCLLTACSLGKSVGMIALNDDQCDKHRELAAAYGLSSRLAATLPMTPAIDEYLLEADADTAAPLIEGVQKTCAALVAAGAEVIVPGDGVLNDFIWRHAIRPEASGAVLMDAAGTLIHHATFMGRARQALGLGVSRKSHYARPDGAMLAHFRDFDRRHAMLEGDYSGLGTITRD